MIFPWEASRGDKAGASPAPKPGGQAKKGAGRGSLVKALPQVRQRARTSQWRTASTWATARKSSAGNVTQRVPTGASPPPAATATTATIAQPSTQPQMSQRVHGKAPRNDDDFLVKLGTQAGFRGRWYCGRLLDPADVKGACAQCGPDGGPQCNSCARFQSVYEPDLNDDGHPVKRSTSIAYCYNFYCGRPGVVAGTGGPCGPHEGPQCPSCQRLQESFKAYHVNDEGCTVLRGTGEGYRGKFYCGRLLGVKAIPGSDGRCGPVDGPQCQSCKRFQTGRQIVIDEEPKPRIGVTLTGSSTASKVKQEPLLKAAAESTTTPADSSVQRSGASSEPDIVNDEGCKLNRGTREGYTQTFYCGRKLGTAAIPGSPSGKCGPDEGPQCPACRRYQTSLEVDVNDDGVLVKVGTVQGFTNTYFCGRRFAEEKTKVSFQCGPNEGIQCSSCRRFQMLRRRKAKDGHTAKIKQESEREAMPKMEEKLRLTSQQKRKQPEAKQAKAKVHPKPQEVKTATPLVLCTACGKGDREAELLLCDTPNCGRATHLGCCEPPLAAIPEGDWFCTKCAMPPQKRARSSKQPAVSPAAPRPPALSKVPVTKPVYPAVPGVLLCTVCNSGERAAELLLCDTPGCDRATHLRCCTPRLDDVPDGDWFCTKCDPPTPPAKRKRQTKPTARADRREADATMTATKGKGKGKQGREPEGNLSDAFKAIAAATQEATALGSGEARSLE
mmetsp:Transcript_64037/g.113903  ORF Transcript_64037/g.113903 Transcript_64037/m.113903 type:complete len:725 (-) Transcript_64037:44-2218(-)|eukprot:CAMPEP_0197629530 /NCGR_PEP_ID=MMETSP1338-20131121/7336_1 /TAXON_ID=43686 ORGANISM="Pelagodinium beii, Strain RCC1491" /NCGR_SAMPLE_ID=MMETSP1338 /ASSEMBLY_ACC=CAM_ASM_000754 /LENGTH=724 /DNA_ID=CAMNT_0043200581 /DNA_START=109 /DNA_END=2283 /DNA_ORIENTATION=+